jgi:hypothetical protein
MFGAGRQAAHLDGDVALQLDVVALVDHTLGAFAQDAQDPETTDLDRRVRVRRRHAQKPSLPRSCRVHGDDGPIL